MPLTFQDYFEEAIVVVRSHLLALALIVLVVVFTKKTIKQTGYEQFSFYWYLFNGAIIHITWDGLIGGFDYCPPLLRAYALMDNRFNTKQNVAFIVSLCELLIHGPICLYTARLFLNSRGLKRDLFSIISSFIQIIGTILYLYDEYLNNFANVCQEGSCFTFSNSNIAFFWICFLCLNPIWILLPSIQIYFAYNNMLAQDKWSVKNCAIENQTSGNYYDDYCKVERVPKPKKVKNE